MHDMCMICICYIRDKSMIYHNNCLTKSTKASLQTDEVLELFKNIAVFTFSTNFGSRFFSSRLDLAVFGLLIT